MSQKEAIIAEIVGTHQRNYPILHHGRKASYEEITEWIKKLYACGFEEGQLLLFLNDEKSRNQLLGNSWYR